jgi:hypothetical protein
MKMEVASSSEMLVYTYKTTWCHSENLKSY